MPDTADPSTDGQRQGKQGQGQGKRQKPTALPELPHLTVAYVGDSANVLHDLLVALPRLGHKVRVASPASAGFPESISLASLSSTQGSTLTREQLQEERPWGAYRPPRGVWERVEALGCNKNDGIWYGSDPRETVKGADVVVTDTW